MLNRSRYVSVNLQEAFKGTPKIPYLSDTKEFLQKHDELNYAIPQFVGGDSAVMVLRFNKKKGLKLMTLVNPTYLSMSGIILSEETQYGVEGVYLVPRHPKIEIMFVKLPEGIPVRQVLIGKSALVFQQAYDAMNGQYICDFGMRIDDNKKYQEMSIEEKEEYGKAYFEALKDVLADLEKDEEVKKYEEAVTFTTERIAVGVEADKIIQEARNNEQTNVGSEDGSEISK